jgi:hypothetical protein
MAAFEGKVMFQSLIFDERQLTAPFLEDNSIVFIYAPECSPAIKNAGLLEYITSKRIPLVGKLYTSHTI